MPASALAALQMRQQKGQLQKSSARQQAALKANFRRRTSNSSAGSKGVQKGASHNSAAGPEGTCLNSTRKPAHQSQDPSDAPGATSAIPSCL